MSSTRNCLLVTFGCSWTYGVGSAYTTDMDKTSFESVAWDGQSCYNKSFRGILCNKYKLDNYNLSSGGSSNQRQFRLAKKYFSSKTFLQHQRQYKNITVLWGITSTARGEFFVDDKLQNIFYNKNDSASKIITKKFYNHDHEVYTLAQEIDHWNNYFKLLGVENHWFDTFNHHDYKQATPAIETYDHEYSEFQGIDWPNWQEYKQGILPLKESVKIEISDMSRFNFAQLANDFKIDNLLYKERCPRDLLSLMLEDHTLDTNYHASDWRNDSSRIQQAIDTQLVNPFSFHPTHKGHKKIANLLEKVIDFDQ